MYKVKHNGDITINRFKGYTQLHDKETFALIAKRTTIILGLAVSLRQHESSDDED